VRAALFRFAAVLALSATFAHVDADDGARAAAATFGSALVAGSAEALRPILPERGRVHVSLKRMGPEEGMFGARQVEALFRDFLAKGKVASFDVKFDLKVDA
jgi:hypothetical protein